METYRPLPKIAPRRSRIYWFIFGVGSLICLGGLVTLTSKGEYVPFKGRFVPPVAIETNGTSWSRYDFKTCKTTMELNSMPAPTEHVVTKSTANADEYAKYVWWSPRVTWGFDGWWLNHDEYHLWRVEERVNRHLQKWNNATIEHDEADLQGVPAKSVSISFDGKTGPQGEFILFWVKDGATFELSSSFDMRDKATAKSQWERVVRSIRLY